MPIETKDSAEHLLQSGRSKGYVTFDDLVCRIPPAQSTDEANDLLAELDEGGIEIVGEDLCADIGDDSLALEADGLPSGAAKARGKLGASLRDKARAEPISKSIESTHPPRIVRATEPITAIGSTHRDPVASYMRQLRSVPLLTREEEVETAQRLEQAKSDLLESAMRTSVAAEEMLRLGKQVRAGEISIGDILEPDTLREQIPDNEIDSDEESKAARKRFLALITRLETAYRKTRDVEDIVDASTAKPEEVRRRLRRKAESVRERMLAVLDNAQEGEIREVHLNAVVARIDELVEKLKAARLTVREIESEAKISVRALRTLMRQRRKGTSAEVGALGRVMTGELPIVIPTGTTQQHPAVSADDKPEAKPDRTAPLASSVTQELPAVSDRLSDESIERYANAFKAAQVAIRAIEREANTSGDELIVAHRSILEARKRAQSAKDGLVLANQRLVVHIAGKYINRGMLFLELVQEGNLGLMRAADKFDWRRGYKFSTYGTWWIRHAISRAIANQTRTIRLPVHVRDGIRKLIKESQRHVLAVGREPTTEELAERTEMSVAKVSEMMEASRQTLRWELPVGEDGETEFGSMFADEDAPSPFDHVNHRSQWMRILKAMATIGDRERRVLTRRFGLDGRNAHTLEEVGAELGITRERVRQIQARALRKLQLAVHESAL